MFRNSMQWLGVAFLSVAALVVASGAATAQSYVYSLTDLTYGITSDCHPTGFNNSGWAVGNYYGNPDGSSLRSRRDSSISVASAPPTVSTIAG